MKKRSYLIYGLLLLFTLVLGFTSRWQVSWYPDFYARYAGDTWWAILVYWGLSLLGRRMSPVKIAIGALSFAFLIEFSQLYQADWIIALRNTTLGSLVLGHGFLWSDLLCYSVGIGLAFLLDRYLSSSTSLGYSHSKAA
ncbi:MAG: DUF2809 domain-containing protein [Bacteroidota bacterium]